MHYPTATPAAEAAANALFQAQRTGCADAIDLARRQQAAAGFFARNRAACDYTNELASDPNRFAIAAEADRNETGYAATLN